jgi:hypothetical protein
MGPTKLVRQGVVPLAHRGRWLAFKTLWFSLPSYDGPFIVRARRLDGSGRVRFGETPSAPEIVVRGPTVNQSHGYREVPGGTWLKAPGCYAWQVDGQGFSHVIVFEAVLHGH